MDKIRFFRNCEELSIYAFHKIMEKSDYSYLVRGWDEYSEIKFDREEAVKIWGGIYNEYSKLTSNNKIIRFYALTKKLIYLETRKEIGGRLLSQLILREMDKETFGEYVQALKDWGFPYSKKERNLDELEKMSRLLRAADNEIAITKEKIKDMREVSEEIPFEKQVVKLEQALGRNSVNPRETSVKKWVYMMQEISEINEQRRLQAQKNKR